MNVGFLSDKVHMALALLLCFGVTVFFAGMIIWGRHESMLVSHYLILLPVLILVCLDYRRLPLAFSSVSSKIFLVFLLAVVGRALLEEDSRESWFVVKNCLILLAVFLSFNYMDFKSLSFSSRVLSVVGIVGFFVMLLTLGSYITVFSGFEQRLRGEGVLSNPLYAGLVFGALTACFIGVLIFSENKIIKSFSFLACVVGILLVLSTKGKGVYLALLVAMLPIIVASNSKGRLLLFILSLLIGLGLLFSGILDNIFSRSWTDEWRIKIWLNAWDVVRQSPLLGEGLNRQADVHLSGRVWNHSHNLIIDAARLAGLPVAIMFALLIGSVLWESLMKMGKQELVVASGLLFSVVALMTNGRFPVLGRFDAHWVAFWLPLLWLLSRINYNFSSSESAKGVAE